MSYLTFNTLRNANRQRQLDVPKFRHPEWALSAWSNATLGELGEAANIIKKIERGDFKDLSAKKREQVKKKLAKELADTVTYLDLLAQKAGIDLGEATISKFNEISRRVKCSIRIDAEGWHYLPKKG